jgi:hypothetical protein
LSKRLTDTTAALEDAIPGAATQKDYPIMHKKILEHLAGRTFKVTILEDGEVVVQPDYLYLDTPCDACGHAVCNEIKSALEDALASDNLGGYCFDEGTDTLQEIAGREPAGVVPPAARSWRARGAARPGPARGDDQGRC